MIDLLLVVKKEKDEEKEKKQTTLSILKYKNLGPDGTFSSTVNLNG